jgi:hypothetical protein
MAGTRLYIQSLVLLELLALAIWSFSYGLCRNDDVLCRSLWDLVSPGKDAVMELPPLTTMSSLPAIQVERAPYVPFAQQITHSMNPNTIIVCSQPESPVVQGQTIWRCPSQVSPKVVLRQSSLVVYSQESDLESLLLPKVGPRTTLQVHLIVEETNDTASVAQRWATILENDLATIDQWPCVEDVQVHMAVVPAVTNQWLVPQQSPQEGTNDTIAALPKLTKSHVDTLLEKVKIQEETSHLQLVVYIPATTTKTTRESPSPSFSAWKVHEKQLVLVGGADASSVHQWLSAYMGVPSVIHNDSDGSFPTWYGEWYWQSAATQLSEEITKEFGRVQHLLRDNIIIGNNDSTTRDDHNHGHYYQELQRVHQHLQHTLSTSSLEAHFPLEHYAAIFAPLLFPLLVPFLTGLYKEYKRYQEKKKKHKEGETAKRTTKEE